MMRQVRLFISLNCTLLFSVALPAGAEVRYIENDDIKLGIDLNKGGSITFLSDKRTAENLINNADLGRQIQMSFYSGPTPFEPPGKKANPTWRFLGWNPIQSGDVAGNSSKILDVKQTSSSLYVKCIPMHWPLESFPGECIFESSIEIEKKTVKVHGCLINDRPDKKQYAARDQELPAVYTNGPYHRLVTYTGKKPFTSDTVSTIKNHNFPDGKSINWESWQAPENWAANLNDEDFGVGVYNGETQSFIGGYYGNTTFTGGSSNANTGYISPVSKEVLDYNITFSYDYTLIVGSLDEIRGYVYQQPRKDKVIRYEFQKDRQHWYFENTPDAGWPIKGELVIGLNPKAAMVGPRIFVKSKDVSFISLEAAVDGEVDTMRLLWRTPDKDFNHEHSMDFPVKPDGQMRSYKIFMKDNPNYKGIITGLKIELDPLGKSTDQDKVRIRTIEMLPLARL